MISKFTLYDTPEYSVSIHDIHQSYIPDTEQQIIQSLLGELSTLPAIEGVYLYGSYARSEQKPYSDVDIAVITRSSTPSRSIREKIGSYASKKLDVQVFSDLPLPAQMQVFSQGIPLFIRDSEFMRELIHLISLTYMDLEPMRERWKKRMLGGVHEIV
jgi:predicted nucleotidyltransferase